MSKGKLHEVIAVEEDRRGRARKIVQEATTTFKSKQGHFIEQIVRVKPIEEGTSESIEGHKTMDETVNKKLDYVGKTVSDYLDAFYQKEKTNTLAKSDVVLSDGTTILRDVPATALLGLERELNELRKLYDSIPTLEPGLVWNPVPDKGADIKVTESSKVRTKKKFVPLVLAQATKEHPAQVKEGYEDLPVAEVVTTTYSSKYTPAEKSSILDRIDMLKTAVKSARMRANTAEADNTKIGKTIFNFINKGMV